MTCETDGKAPKTGGKLWDLPTRVFHWLLVACFAVSWWAAENGRMNVHILSGCVLLGLLVFRLLWGFFGSESARFASFVCGPAAIWRHMRGAGVSSVGHNPLGALSVVAMLAALGLQVATGLVAVDVDGLDSGPLSHMVTFDQGRAASAWHETIFDILLMLAALHVAAVLAYLLFARRNLIRPMITGYAREPLERPLRFAPWPVALACAAAGAGAAWFAWPSFPWSG